MISIMCFFFLRKPRKPLFSSLFEGFFIHFPGHFPDHRPVVFGGPGASLLRRLLGAESLAPRITAAEADPSLRSEGSEGSEAFFFCVLRFVY